jgi:transposase-like protein
LEEPYPYLILDARYEKVREDGAVRSQAVLIAIGILRIPGDVNRAFR